ncbi:MAG: hypothetical protein ACXVHQ_41665, partial [Solirubrobacteraceae bacterium]
CPPTSSAAWSALLDLLLGVIDGGALGGIARVARMGRISVAALREVLDAIQRIADRHIHVLLDGTCQVG